MSVLSYFAPRALPPGLAAKARSLTCLSLLCFALADVRDGLGPFLGIFLQSHGWTPDSIGYVMTIGGLAGMAVTTPLGALADATRHKRLLLALASTGIVAALALIFLCQHPLLVGCDHFQSAFIGRAIMDADIFISLTHFKGHELTGFGGAIKNIGTGCGSRAGKMAMHSIGKPSIDPEKCRGCKTCTHYCAQSAISIGDDHKARIDHDLCAGCGRCIGVCNFDAISNAFDAESVILNERMAEYTKAVIQGRPHFHVSIVNQVSPYCDCHAENDAAVVPDIGMFASFDPVALDHACIDAVNAAPAISTSALGQCAHEHNDHFTDIHPSTNWRSQIEHAQKIGIGNMDYELVTVK